jgi:geranylgeranyl pyrophosphate synthase
MPGGSRLADTLSEEGRAVEEALERSLGALLPLLPAGLRPPVRHGVLTGGKRLRPILAVMAFRACGGEELSSGLDAPGGEGTGIRGGHGRLHDLAVSLELIHAYSLMHDDLPCMDDAALRRGRETPHTLFGEGVTATAGATLIPAAGLQLLWSARGMGIPEAEARELLRILARAAGGGGMVGGQALDLEGEGRSLGREELDGLHRRKTGALLEASLELGAVAAGADPPLRLAMTRYGRAIGLAFQIADDILDATATREVLGKAPSDTALDKSTYVALLGVEGARAEARSQVDLALEALQTPGLRLPAAAVLEELARFVVERDR